MIATVLPDSVRSAESFGDDDEPDAAPGPLLALEAAAVDGAAPARRREHAAVRRCARRALAGLGMPAVAILNDADRAPLWPAEVVGSMTHCSRYRAAAVGRQDRIATIGIDAEPVGPLPPDVLGVVALAEERAMLGDLAEHRPDVAWDRVLFSAKEAVFKAWYPLTRRWLDFADAAVRIGADGTFAAHLLVRGPEIDGRRVQDLPGRWCADEHLVVTAVVLER